MIRFVVGFVPVVLLVVGFVLVVFLLRASVGFVLVAVHVGDGPALVATLVASEVALVSCFVVVLVMLMV